MRIEIPEFALVAMIGVSSSGKSTFAGKHFLKTEVLSSDFFRGMISDDENDQKVSHDAFDLLYYAAGKRLRLMKTTVIDATNVQQQARKQIIDLARDNNVHSVAIVLDLSEKVLRERNASRPDRGYADSVIRKQRNDLKRSIRNLRKEGFRFVYVLESEEDIDSAEIVRTRLWNNRKDDHGPFDIIGDVHGCYDELVMLLEKLGYVWDEGEGMRHPEGRKAVFLGDLCDRGSGNVKVLKLVMEMTGAGNALAVPGNHDIKLLRYLSGKDVRISHGLAVTIDELMREDEAFREKVRTFLNSLISHYVLDDGRLAVSHAGLKEEYIGRGSIRVRDFCLYGETTGETDEYGMPVRLNWPADYRGKPMIVYGHTPATEVRALNGTYCIDTGCVFGGKLTAMRYPERELVSVDALRQYYEPVRPLGPEKKREYQDDLPVYGDVNGRMHIETELIPSVTVNENNAAAALEVMSRFAADPHWIIYLPPTMSPCETSGLEGFLEHPEEAFSYYRNRGVINVVCEKKHMGSRAVIVLARTAGTARERFGVSDGRRGIIYTRTGRHFFDDRSVEEELLERLDRVLTERGFWDDFATDWVCLDTELMPWSEKARTLLERQYAPAGRAARESLASAVGLLKKTCLRNDLITFDDKGGSGKDTDPGELLKRFEKKQEAVNGYTEAYREYCWEVSSADDIRIAPFHIMACEGRVFSEVICSLRGTWTVPKERSSA
jgi:protein phosphatase